MEGLIELTNEMRDAVAELAKGGREAREDIDEKAECLANTFKALLEDVHALKDLFSDPIYIWRP